MINFVFSALQGKMLTFVLVQLLGHKSEHECVHILCDELLSSGIGIVRALIKPVALLPSFYCLIIFLV